MCAKKKEANFRNISEMDLATVIGKCNGLTIDSLPNDMRSIMTEFGLTDEELHFLNNERLKRKGKI